MTLSLFSNAFFVALAEHLGLKGTKCVPGIINTVYIRHERLNDRWEVAVGCKLTLRNHIYMQA